MVDFSKRDLLKLSGLAGGAVALGSGLGGCGLGSTANAATGLSPEKNTLFANLPEYILGSKPVVGDMMRITFLGTTPLERLTQSCTSVFVELGNGESFVFDCGAGVTVNYTTMQIAYSKMRKIFLTHLHGDHTSDLTHIYCFGPQGDAKSPLYIWGPSASGVPDPQGNTYDDGTLNFAYHFREMNRWHTESQSFVPTRYTDSEGDGYDLFATELNWKTGDTSRFWTTRPSIPKPTSSQWVAYEANGVRISYFPAIHGRAGSVSYKLEWKGLSMIFTGDTKPNRFLIENASNGPSAVDVLISEMVVPRNSGPPSCPARAIRTISSTSSH
jgi:ribonuclease Z